MSHLDKRRVLGALSRQLLRGESLSPEQSKYLGMVLLRIANGENANTVLGVSKRQGQKNSDAVARQRMSLILHWVAGAIEDPPPNEKPLTVEQACEEAVKSIVPIANPA